MAMTAKQTATSSVQQRESQTERFDRIYKGIRERICLLDYRPGALLNEGHLAEEFGVSRTPVRNVLQRLNYEGLVETRNGVGTIVTDLNFKTFKDIYELRMRLAEMTGALSPTAPTPEILNDLKRLRTGVEMMKEGPADHRSYAHLCNELHELLLDLIGNQALREMTDLLYYRAARIWLTFLHNLDWREETEIMWHEICEILRALEIGDMRGVGNARRQYLYMTLTRISRYLVNV
ncbi:MAG: GntR family transcriptional regulator [Alphaproteobacteria bacterium]|nr:GntR family transcriptional regulator [Alphaproteobacteria bacterium]